MESINALAALSGELDEYVNRLNARAQVIKSQADAEPDLQRKDLLFMIAESFQEQVDTGLDFMRELIVRMGEIVVSIGAGEAGEGEEVGLEPEDATRILGVLTEHQALLEQTVIHVQDSAEKLRVQGMLKNTKDVIELVQGLILEDDNEDEVEGTDEEEA